MTKTTHGPTGSPDRADGADGADGAGAVEAASMADGAGAVEAASAVGVASTAATTSAAGTPSTTSEPAPASPSSLPEIADRIGEVREELAGWFGGLPAEDLFRRLPGAWAPIDDLRHLVRVNAALVKGLGYPHVALRLRFGRVWRKPWPYERLVTMYDALLASGVKSPAPFEPRTGVVADREAYRERVLGQWRSVNEQLLGRVARLSERRADRIALPHPGMGLMSIREMLFFTIHHDLHHLGVAKRRVVARSELGD